MKDKSKRDGNPYETNKGGFIKAPKNVSSDDPKGSKKTGNDLRVKGGK